MEVDGDPHLVPRRYRVHGRDVQKRRQDDICKGAVLKDPSGIFNSSLDGNVRRAIDIHEGDKVDEAALKDLIRPAVARNLMVKSKPKPRRASGKPAVTSFIAGAGRISSHKGRASAPASYAKHFGVNAPELAAEARSGNAGKAAKSSLRNQSPPGIPALSLRGF